MILYIFSESQNSENQLLLIGKFGTHCKQFDGYIESKYVLTF